MNKHASTHNIVTFKKLFTDPAFKDLAHGMLVLMQWIRDNRAVFLG